MRNIQKKWKRVFSLMMVIAMMLTMMPNIGIYAAEANTVEIKLSSEETELEPSANGSYELGLDEDDVQEAIISITVYDDDAQEVPIEGTVLNIQSSNSEVVSVESVTDEDTNKTTYTVKAVGRGEAEIMITATYTIEGDGDASQECNSTGSVKIQVLETPEVELEIEENIYWSETISFVLPDMEGTYEVIADNLTILTENATALPAGTEVQLKAENEIGPATVNVAFTPAIGSGYREFTEDATVNVKRIPVKAEWTGLNRIYDGTTVFTTEADPNIVYAGDGEVFEGFEAPQITSLETYTFQLADANAGVGKVAALNETLSLVDVDHYELILTDALVDITPIVLTEASINDAVAIGKNFDGTSAAKFTTAPSLKEGEILEADFNSLELSYEAHYYNENGEKVKGDPDNNETATKVIISNFEVMDSNDAESPNYVFDDSVVKNITTDDGYQILSNDYFGLDTEENLGTAISENRNGKVYDIYWYTEETGKELTFDGFQFSTDWESDTWEDSYVVNSEEPVALYAKDGNGQISKTIYVANDTTAPQGLIYAKVGENEALSITELSANYKTIAKGKDITISFVGNDAASKIEKIEWCGSDTAWEQNDADAWAAVTDATTITFNEEAEKSTEVNAVLQEITSAEQIKKFYYVRITDFAGNVSYASSSGVLQDIILPTTTVTIDTVADQKSYDGKNVFKENISFTIDVSDGEGSSDITSGVAEVQAVLKDKNGTVVAEYSVSEDTDKFWVNDANDEDETIDAIKVLGATNSPTEEQISKANGILKGTLADLQEGTYSLSVTATDKAGNASVVSTVDFIIDNEAPVIEITNNLLYNSQRKDTSLYTGGSVIVKISDITLSTDTAEIEKLIGGAESTASIVWGDRTVSDNGTITQTAEITFGKGKQYEEGTFCIDIEVVDAMGNTNTDTTDNFGIDFTAPVYSVVYSATDADAYTGDANTLYYNKDIVAKFKLNDTLNLEDSDVTILVKNSAGKIVMKWDGTASTLSDKYVLTHEAGTYDFEFKIVADSTTDDAGYTFEIQGTDKAGNVLTAQGNADSQLGYIRVMDSTAPVLENVDYQSTGTFYSVAGTDYINAETDLVFTIREVNPISSISFVTSDLAEKNADWAKAGENVYTTSIEVKQNGEKGDLQTVSLDTVDKAGNKAVLGTSVKLRSSNTSFADGVFKDHFVVDTVVPTIKYEYSDYTPNRLNVEGVDYFKQQVTVQITVDEHNFNADLFDLSIGKNDENVVVKESEWITNGDIHVKTVTFNEDNQYDIVMKAYDCAKNPTVLIPTEGITVVGNNKNGTTTLSVAVDKTLPDIGDTAKPVIVITPAETDAKTDETENAQPLYHSDVTYEVVVYDPETNLYAAGIDNLIFKITAEDGTEATATMSKNGTITSETGILVECVSGKLENLAKGKEQQYVFHVTIDDAVFNSNGIVLSVEAEDIAENTKTLATTPIAIDITAPKVNVSYSNDNVSNDTYFGQDRVATITVTERNFSNDCLQFMVNGEDVKLSFSLKDDGTGNHDNRVWEATYTFNTDNDYSVSCEMEDRAKNDASIEFTGNATQQFTIDKIKPVIEITFENGTVYNEMFYDAQRVATITITEHNFNPEAVVIQGEGSEAGTAVTYPSISTWSSNGDVHTATITYSEDARYTLDVEYTDYALNVADDVAQHEFVIDKLIPEITISGVEDGQSYTDEVLPQISFSDNNYDSFTVQLTRTERENIGVDVTEQFISNIGVNVDGTGRGDYSQQVEDIPHEKENDGIYTLTVNVFDKAGHSLEETVTFSVNRFGTVYVYSEDLAALANGYYQAIDGDLYISAFNADPLVENMVKLDVTCDGAKVENQQTSADVASALQQTGGGWYEYMFDLSLTDFEQDGCYEIIVSDKDEAGNTKTNSDSPIRFYKDATAPMLDSVIGLEESIINANEQIVQYAVSDAIALNSISIYVNDEEVDKIEEFENATAYEGSFAISTGVRQNVRIVVEDKAGNILDTMDEAFNPAYSFNNEITVSTSAFDRWIANTALFWSSIAGMTGLTGGAVVFGVKKARIRLKREL